MNIRSNASSSPFSLVSGQGLGISHSSHNSLDSFLPERSFGQADVKCAANMATGNLVIQDHVLRFPDIGDTIELSYIYNSNDLTSPWQLNYGRKINKIEENQCLHITESDGHVTQYYHSNDGNYYASTYQEGMPYIRYDANTKTWNWYHPLTRKTECFNVEGYLDKSVDKSGNVTSYKYDNGQLKTIIAPSGINYEIKRSSDKVEVYLNKDKLILLHTYVLDSSGNLKSSITSDQFEISYIYNQKNKQIEKISQTDGSELQFSFYYDELNKNKLETLQIGSDKTNKTTFVYENKKTTFKDVSGVESTLIYNEKNQPVLFKTDDNELQYTFNAGNQIETIVYPDKSQESFEYNNKTGLLIRHTRRDGTSTVFHYSGDNIPLLIAKNDYEKNSKTSEKQTQYIYDEQFNEKHAVLRFEISACGRVKEYVPNKRGQVVQEREFLVDLYTKDEIPSLDEMQKWKLEKRNISKTTLREFTYDLWGNLECERLYSDVNSEGEGIKNDQGKETKYRYDDLGNITYEEIKCENNKSLINTFKFDDIGRSTQEIKGENSSSKQVTTYDYQSNITVMTLPNQRKQCNAFNSEGLIEKELALVGNVDKRETSHKYSAKGRVRVTTLPDENKTFEFYDKHQRLQSTVSASGIVKEYSYNNQHRYLIKTEYANPIDVAALYPSQSSAAYYFGSYLGYQKQSPNHDLLVKALKEKSAPEFDRVFYTFYGTNDELRAEVDAKGYLTEYQYNSGFKLTHTIQYKDTINEDELKVLLSGGQLNRKPDRTKDRVYSNFYDKDNHKIGEQDPAGYITEYILDARGQITEEIHYKTTNLAIENEFNSIRPISQSKDAHHYFFYNSDKQCEMEVNAEGYITQNTYYPNGEKNTTKQYANKVQADWYKNTSIAPIVNPCEKDEETQFIYDDLRRLSSIHKPSGEIITYVYDEMNHQTAKHSRDKKCLSSNEGDHFRGTESRFDGWGQETAHANEFITQKLAKTMPQTEKEKIWNSSSIRSEHNKIGLKVKSRDPKGNITLYYYDKEQRPVLVIDATGAVVENIYNTFGEIITKHKYYNRIAKNVLDKLVGGYISDEIRKCIHADDKKDVVIQYKRDKRGQVFEKIDGEGHIYKFNHDAFKQCIHKHLPVNEKTPSLHIEHEYELRGLETKTIKSAANEKSIVTQKKYDHYLGRQTELIDEIGTTTEYIRDKIGNVEKVLKKLTSGETITTESTVYDAFLRPTQKTDGDLVTVNLDHETKNREISTTTNGDNSKKTIQKNIFGGTIEIIKGLVGQETILHQESFTHAPDGQIETHTTYTDDFYVSNKTVFDLLGHKTEETDERKIKTLTEYDAAYHVKSITVNAENINSILKTSFEPNAFGQDEVVVDPHGVKTKNVFDRCDNLLRSVHDADKNGLNLISDHSHNAQNTVTNTFQGDLKNENQHHEKNEYDSFNRLKAAIIDPEGLKIRTEFQHDAAGNVTKETDPMGHIKRTYYNELKQKRYEITELDENYLSATEYKYTHAGRLKSLRTYHVSISKNAITDNTKLSELNTLLKKDNYDTVTLFFHDNQGRDRFKLRIVYSEEKNQFEALIEEKLYDAAGRENQTTQYATPLLIKDFKNLTIDRIAPVKSDKDRVTYRWYNKGSQERVVIDQSGHAVEKWYDPCGRVIAEISFSQPIKNPSQYLSINAKNVLSHVKADPKQDRRIYYVYDEFGRLQYTVKSNGQVIRKDYDKNNNIIQVCEFKNPLPLKVTYLEVLEALKSYLPDSKKDIITITTFDKCNRIESIEDAARNVDKYIRDSLGNAKTHIDRADNEWRFEYDRANRLTEEISPKTTITTVSQNDKGVLEHSDEKDKKGNNKISVVKKTNFDKANNAQTITEGEGLEEKRVCQFTSNANKQPTSITLEKVLIDDPDLTEAYKHPDLTVLPNKSTTITKKILYSTKDKKIAEQNEKGKWSYYIYDSAERLIYTILNEHHLTKYTYNAFDQKDSECSYATPVHMDFASYREGGLIDIKPLLKHPTSNQDRMRSYEYDASGEKTKSKSSSVFYYSDGKSGMAEPETKYVHNTFGEVIYEAKLIRPGVWAEIYTWRDKCGRIIAQINENNYLTIYERNGNGDVEFKTEYAAAILNVSTKWTLDDLKQKLVQSEEDRRYQIEFDEHHHPVSETVCVWNKKNNKWVAPVTQKVKEDKENHKPQLEDVRVESKKKWTYTPTEQLSSTTHEDGSKEYRYYDERDILIGETKVTRTCKNIDGKIEKITPLNLYKLNAFGQTVVKQTSSEGAEAPQENKLPSFIKPLNVNEEISLIDNRGLTKIKQDAEQKRTAFTYSSSRKGKRELQSVDIWHRDYKTSPKNDLAESWFDLGEQASVNANPNLGYVYKGKYEGFVKENGPLMTDMNFADKHAVFSQKKYVDEKKINYNHDDLPENVSWLRDGKNEETVHSQYNDFGDLVAEGLSVQNTPMQRKLDSQGNPWFANGENGESTLMFYDLRGKLSLRVRALEDDLSKISYEGLGEVLKWDAKRLERTETIHDKAGNATGLKSPIWFKEKNLLPTRQYLYDRWNNIIKEIDSLGHETTYKFNYQNQTIKIIQPEVDVITRNGIKKRMPIVTEFGYNTRGFKIGTKDAQGNVYALELDEAGQCLAHILPDGTREQTKIFDALGQPKFTRDATGMIWEHEYYKNGLPNKTFYPSKNRFIVHQYDGKKGLSSTSHSDGFILRYNNDVRGNTWERYLPLGQCTRIVSDHNGQPIHIKNPGDATLDWDRDYYGNPLLHKELNDCVIKYEYDYAKNLHHQYSKMKPDWQSAYYRRDIKYSDIDTGKKLPYISFHTHLGKPFLKDVYYDHAYGQLERIEDIGLGKKQVYTNDTEGRKNKVEIYDIGNDKPAHIITTTLDELGRESLTVNQHTTVVMKPSTFTMETNYDEINNTRLVQMKLTTGGYCVNCPDYEQKEECWYDHDSVSRTIVNNGVMMNGEIIIQPGKGMRIGYKNNTRVHEQTIDQHFQDHVKVILKPDEDGRLNHIEATWKPKNNKSKTKYIKDRLYTQSGYTTTEKKQIDDQPRETLTTREVTLNKNQWVESEKYISNREEQTSFTDYSNLPDGNPKEINTKSKSNKDGDWLSESRRKLEYAGTDDFILKSVTDSIKTKQHDWTNGMATFGMDSNGIVNGKMHSQDEFNGKVFYETAADGQVLNKQSIHLFNNKESNFLFNADMELKAGYSIECNESDEFIHNTDHSNKIDHHRKDTRPKVSDLVIQNTVFPAGQTSPKKSGINKPLNWDDANSDVWPAFYTVQPGDSLELIAVKLYGDANAAGLIAKINGLVSAEHSIKAGHVLSLPEYFTPFNKAGQSRPYNQFRRIIMGSLSPHIVFPHSDFDDDDDKGFGVFVKVVALAIVIAAAPGLAGLALQAAGIGTALLAGTSAAITTSTLITDAIATGVVAAIGDAAVQGVAIGLGVQSKFSVPEMFETGVSAGVGQGLGSFDITSPAAVAKRALEEGISITATQLIEMKAGLRDKFDAKAVALQVTSSIGSAYINKGVEYLTEQFQDEALTSTASNVVNTTANSLLGHAVIGTPINVQVMAANAIGSSVGNQVRFKSKSNEPEELKKLRSIEKKQTTSSSHEVKLKEINANSSGVWSNEPRNELVNYQLDQVNIIAEEEIPFRSLVNEHLKQDVKLIADEIVDTVNDLKKDPVNFLINTEVSTIKNNYSMFFNPGSVAIKMGQGIREVYNKYNTSDNSIKRDMQADLVSKGLEFVVVAGVTKSISSSLPRLSMFANRAALRSRIELNISESKLAREKSNFSVLEHKSNALNIELEARVGRIANSKIRYWYNEIVATINKMNEQWIRHGISLEERSINAYNVRHEARLQARTYMKPKTVERLQKRDIIKYQNPDGPTFEYLFNKYQSKGYTAEEIYQTIINKSQETDQKINRRFSMK